MRNSFYNLQFGILGGGQLGRMLLQKAIDYNISGSVLDPDPDAPCRYLSPNFVNGSFGDYDTVYEFGRKLDLITIEIEHVNTDALLRLEKEGVRVYPQPRVIALVQDKGMQKIFYRTHGIPTADFHLSDLAVLTTESNLTYPCVQKLRRGGYDGKGVMILRSEADLSSSLKGPSVIEKCIDFEREISVIVSRNGKGECSAYPPVDMEFNEEANLVEYLFSPGSLSEEQVDEARNLAIHVAESLQIIGVLAVEMFLTRDGKILVNEIAPRPHNSGHHTIEANLSSQYDQHLRAILGLSPGSTRVIKPSAMINLLGEAGHSGPALYEGLEKVMSMEGIFVHLYGKKFTKPFRKMGHITILGDSLTEVKSKARDIRKRIKVISQSGIKK